MQIDKCDVGVVIFAKIQSFVAVLGHIDQITRRLQDHRQVFADIPFVVGHQNPRFRFHHGRTPFEAVFDC